MARRSASSEDFSVAPAYYSTPAYSSYAGYSSSPFSVPYSAPYVYAAPTAPAPDYSSLASYGVSLPSAADIAASLAQLTVPVAAPAASPAVSAPSPLAVSPAPAALTPAPAVQHAPMITAAVPAPSDLAVMPSAAPAPAAVQTADMTTALAPAPSDLAVTPAALPTDPLAGVDSSSYVLPGLEGLTPALNAIQAQLAAHPMTPASPSTAISYQVPQFDTGLQGFSPNQSFNVQDANQYKVYDDTTGKVLFSGSGSDAKTALPGVLSDLSKQYGDQAMWHVAEGAPSYTTAGGTDWTNIAQGTPVLHDNFDPLLAAALGFGLPLAAATIAPALLGAGAASAGSGAATGLDALATAPLSGAAGAAGAADLAASVAPTLGATVAAPAAASGVLGSLASAGAPLDVSSAISGLGDLAASAAPDLSGLAVAAPAVTAPSAAPFGSLPGDISVVAPAAAAPVAASPLAVAGMAALPAAVAASLPAAASAPAADTGAPVQAPAAQPPEAPPADITVNAPAMPAAPPSLPPVVAAIPPLSAAAGIAGAQTAADAVTPPSITPPTPPEAPPADITVTAPPPATAPTLPAWVTDAAAPLSAAAGIAGAQATADAAKPSSTPSAASTALSKLSKALQAGSAISTIAGLLSDPKSGVSGATLPAGIFDNAAPPSSFTSALPAAQTPFTTGIDTSRTNWVVPYTTSAQMAPTMSVMPTVDSVQAALARGAAGGIQATNPMAVIPTPTQPVNKAEGGSVEPRDYDMEGALAAGIKPDKYGHMPDTYKLPNHMTFSEGSVYSTPEHPGGKWLPGNDGSWTFWPTQFNMSQHSMPEMQSYFSRVEQNIPGRPDSFAIYPIDYRLPPRDNKAEGGAMGYTDGGSDRGFAVQGPGTGRSDSIPANLSDGEYVMDAETVALLGDGSSKAGADALDRMRINIRKQKGKNLAQGKFSVKAKAPEAYMTGGRL